MMLNLTWVLTCIKVVNIIHYIVSSLTIEWTIEKILLQVRIYSCIYIIMVSSIAAIFVWRRILIVAEFLRAIIVT